MWLCHSIPLMMILMRSTTDIWEHPIEIAYAIPKIPLPPPSCLLTKVIESDTLFRDCMISSLCVCVIFTVWCSTWHKITFRLFRSLSLLFIFPFFFLFPTGVLQTYHIIVRGYDASLNRSRILTNVTIDASAPTLLLANLTEGVTYTVSVAAANRAGYGPYSLPATLRLDPVTKRLDQSTPSHRYLSFYFHFFFIIFLQKNFFLFSHSMKDDIRVHFELRDLVKCNLKNPHRKGLRHSECATLFPISLNNNNNKSPCLFSHFSYFCHDPFVFSFFLFFILLMSVSIAQA